jgi:hypothetical protein
MTGQRHFPTEYLPSQRNKDEIHSKHAYLSPPPALEVKLMMGERAVVIRKQHTENKHKRQMSAGTY